MLLRPIKVALKPELRIKDLGQKKITFVEIDDEVGPGDFVINQMDDGKLFDDKMVFEFGE